MAIYTNKFRSSFSVTWKAIEDFDGKLVVSSADDSLQGKIVTAPYRKNRLRSEFEAKLPKREIVTTSIVKDTYVTDLTPTLNNGKLEILKVGVDKEGYKYRTMIKVQVPDIVRDKHIIKAELVLDSDEQNGFEGLEVSLADNDWQEYSVVWLGQPSRQRILYTTDLNQGTYTHRLDLTEAVTQDWILSDSRNNGIILKAKNETKEQIINFSSRESYSPPKLEITYIDKDLFLETGSVMSGRIRPQQKGEDEIKGRIDVWRDEDSREIKGRLKVVRDDTVEGIVKVAQLKDLQGKLKVKEWYSDLEGQITTNVDWVFGSINVKAYKDLYGTISPQPQSSINGIVNVMYKDDLSGELVIRPLSYYDMDGTIRASAKTELKGKINVMYKNQIDGTINIQQFTDLKGAVRPTIQLDDALEGILNVIYKSQLTGRIKVNQIALPAKIIVRGKSEIEGKLHSIAQSSINGRIMTAMKTELDGNITSRAREISDLNGKLQLGEIPEIDEDEIFVFIM